MSVNIVTGLTGKSHVTSAQDGRKNAFTFGSGRYVFDSGSKFAYELVSNNLIKILDGDLIDQGRHICTEQNDYTDLTIDNGISGNNRKDLIVMRYQKNADTSIESASLVVIKGTSTSGVASDPDYTEGDILSGDLVDDFPLYRVNLTGLSITSVDRLFEVLPVGGMYGVLSQLDELNTNVNQLQGTVFNIKMAGTGSNKVSLKEIALLVNNGVSFIMTTASMTDVPSGYAYSCGLVLRRTTGQLWIILFKYNSTTIATCSYNEGVWSAWTEK